MDFWVWIVIALVVVAVLAIGYYIATRERARREERRRLEARELRQESEEQARRNADSRAQLAVGPAPGQGGTFDDRFRLGRVSAEGSVATMELEPREGEYVLSDLTSGPVLFATC